MPENLQSHTGHKSPLEDGRQSPAARDIARGSQRLLASLGHASLTEITLPNDRRADLVTLGPKGEIWIIEIKSSVADFAADQKWPDYLDFCDQFYFAVAPDFPADILPADVGQIIADRFGGEVIASAPETNLSPARRKALHLRCARFAASRLHRLADPECIDFGSQPL